MNKIDKFFNANSFEKLAYPNFEYRDPQPSYDIDKWEKAMSQIKKLQEDGEDKFEAIDGVTKTWSIQELDSFIAWMRYYESGDAFKYKYASLYSTSPGYYLQMDSNTKEFKPKFDSNEVVEEQEEEVDDSKERLYILKKKILSRLSSMKKLVSSSDGHEFLKKEVDDVLNVLFDLEKKFTKLKVASLYTFHDELVRLANKNKDNEFLNEFLIKFAQTSAPPPAQQQQLNENVGNPGGIPSTGPGAIPPPNNPPLPPAPNDLPSPPPSPEESVDEDKTKGVSEFVSKMTGKKAFNLEEEYLFVSEAQQTNQVNTPPVNSANTNSETQPAVKSDYDIRIDDLFKNVTVEDVISKLDALSNIFKEREIPRQLSIIDMMLNALNLSQMFPGLSESHNKALESNNYILTRIEDISSKLRGTIKGAPIDLTPKQNMSADPKAEVIKQNLEKQEEAEKRRKELRKQVENEALDKMKETPAIEVSDKPAPVVEDIPAQPPAKVQ